MSWQTLYDLRFKYPHLQPSTLHMRLKAFCGEIPMQTTKTGRIQALEVTEALDAFLRRPVKKTLQP